jgi:hypothetical protein
LATGENDEFKIENIKHLSNLIMFVDPKENVKKCDEEFSKIRP